MDEFDQILMKLAETSIEELVEKKDFSGLLVELFNIPIRSGFLNEKSNADEIKKLKERYHAVYNAINQVVPNLEEGMLYKYPRPV